MVVSADSKTRLTQHVIQLNVMPRAILKEVDTLEPNQIGFCVAEQLEIPVAGNDVSSVSGAVK